MNQIKRCTVVVLALFHLLLTVPWQSCKMESKWIKPEHTSESEQTGTKLAKTSKKHQNNRKHVQTAAQNQLHHHPIPPIAGLSATPPESLDVLSPSGIHAQHGADAQFKRYIKLMAQLSANRNIQWTCRIRLSVVKEIYQNISFYKDWLDWAPHLCDLFLSSSSFHLAKARRGQAAQ